MRNKRSWFIAALIAVSGLGLTVFFLGPGDQFYRRGTFVAEQWTTGDMRARGQMVHDLISKKLLEGRTRAEVETLLGAPDRARTNLFEYRVDVGVRFGGSPWSYDLVVHFDDQGNKVRDIRLVD